MNKTKIVNIDTIGPVAIVRHPRSLRIKLSVKANGEIRVSIPVDAPFSEGEAFVRRKTDWLREAISRVEKTASTNREYTDGEWFRTRHYAYRITASATDRIRIKLIHAEKIMLLEYPQQHNLNSQAIIEGISELIERGLRFEAKRYLPRRTFELAKELGYQVNRVVVKNNKTNWGSCSSLKNINLNLHLMRLPDRLIDFIIVHELVHTTIPNHGPLFKATMKRHFPDADRLNQQIKKIRPTVL